MDGMSLMFVILTSVLVPICLLVGGFTIDCGSKTYFVCFLTMYAAIIGVFTACDLIVFYVCFESVLVPMFVLIGVYGSRERKIRAAYQFFFYTFVGSLCMLVGILVIQSDAGTTNLVGLMHTHISESRSLLLFVAFLASFAVKLPMIGVHTWLPEAHVEAPTSGSVILAGILLKFGGYGLLRFSIPLFPLASAYFAPFMCVLSVCAIVYASLSTMRQIDMKKIIAYSSVAHMGYVTLGMFSGVYPTYACTDGILGGVFMMIAHGVVSSALFICIGVLYERHKTRVLHYFSGCAHVMPVWAILFVVFIFANFGLPTTANFVGEFLVLNACSQTNSVLTYIAISGMFFGAAYSIWLYNRIVFGNIKQTEHAYSDVNRREVSALAPLCVLTFSLGCFPNTVLDVLAP
jgi:proton-translocating NADH-quinone oxidoreductase chain M